MFSELLQTCKDRYGTSDSKVDLATWICDNTTLNKKPFSFKGYEFQQAIASDMHPDLYCEKCSQVGLALALDTPIPTPTGWTTMELLQVGDQVFDETGHPVKVTYKSPVWSDRDCYEVEFDDGEVIVADGSHRWPVEVDRPFDLTGEYSGRGRPAPGVEMFRGGVLDTETISRTYKHGNRNRYAVRNAGEITLPGQDLPVDPYFLGLWLGDGNTHACVLTSHKDDLPHLEDELIRRGMVVLPSSVQGNTHQVRVHFAGQVARPGRATPNSVSSRLNDLGLLGKGKFVPEQYLRASAAQRRDLLRGLMDTDGSVTKNGRCSFYNNNPKLVSAVEELARSLGLKTRTRWRMNAPSVMTNGHQIELQKPVAEVSFVAYAEDEVFALPRKRERLRPRAQGRATESYRRRIVRCEKVASVPTQCITVDSESHLYLAGLGMVPTHNTEVQVRKFFAILRRHHGTSGIFTLPNQMMFKRVYNGRMKPILDADPIFNPATTVKPVRNMDMTQIGDSFGYQTGCTEGDATSISADFLMHDELDLSPMDMIGLFQSRLQNSDMKVTQSFSTPTFLDYGINRGYQLSDQHEYMVKCGACNHHQIPRFDFDFLHIPNFKLEVERITDITQEQIADLDLGGIYVKCEKCSRRLDLANPDMREWVAAFPSRNTRGWKVRPFSTSRIAPGYIFTQLGKYHQRDFLRGFFNTVLGEPFTESSAQLQRQEIEKVIHPSSAIPNVGKDIPVFLGLDMGQICHLTLCRENPENGKMEFVLFEQVPIFQLHERLIDLRQIYSIVQGCVDRYPYTPTVDALRMDTSGLIMPVAYGGRATIAPHRDELGITDYYTANRTAALDRVRTVILNEQVVLAGYGPYRETIIAHLRDMVRDENPEKPDAEPEWKKLNNNDHFFHSMALALLARRVCEHVYTADTSSLLSSAVVTTMRLPSTPNNLGNIAPKTVNRFSTFGLLG